MVFYRRVRNMIIAMTIISSQSESFAFSKTNGRYLCDSQSILPVFGYVNEKKCTTELCSVSRAFSDVQKTLNGREIDMKRLKFQISQMKDEMYEAQLRTRAAEKRARELKQEISEIQVESKIQAEEVKMDDKSRLPFRKEINLLKEKVSFFL